MSIIQEIVTKTKKTKPKVAKSIFPLSYYSFDIILLSDEDLLSEFRRITGYSALYCKHCRGSSELEARWTYAVRKRCMKYGLTSTMDIPKSCDKQLKMNEKCNGVNNEAYRKLRVAKTEEERKDILAKREHELQARGVCTKPNIYTMTTQKQ